MSLAAFYSTVPVLVKDFLQTQPDILAVPIVTITSRDLTDQFNMALSGTLAGPTGKVGLSMIITATGAGQPLENAPVAFNLANVLELTVFDFPMINHDTDLASSLRITGPDLLSSCLAVLKKFKTGESDFAGLNFYEGQPPMDFPEVRPDDGLVIYRGRLLFAGGIEDNTTIIPPPAVAAVGLTVTITPNVAANRTYYTVQAGDGLMVRPQYFGDANVNNAGTLYSAPFAVDDGSTVHARSFISSLQFRASTIASLAVEI